LAGFSNSSAKSEKSGLDPLLIRDPLGLQPAIENRNPIGYRKSAIGNQ
jgi:hypothetical protein